MEVALRVRNLSFRYPSYPGLPTAPLISRLNLELARGEICLLLGRAETGKSTLCRILAGLVPRFFGGRLSGRVLLEGEELGASAPFERVCRIGVVFQNPSEQLFTSRGENEVAFALESLGLPREEMERRVRDALAWMGIQDLRERDPATLSGGEKKKLLLACLKAVDPAVWLLDETFEELDDGNRRDLLARLRAGGRSVLIFSARWHEAFGEFVDRSLLLEQGRLEAIALRPGSRAFLRLLRESGFVPSGRVLRRRRQASLVEAASLGFRYGTDQDFSLQVDRLRVPRGGILAVVGDNGSGKSTLAKLLCGLLSPQSGEVRIEQTHGLEPVGQEALLRFSAYIFQDPDLQIFLPTVEQELAYGLRLAGLGAAEVNRRVTQSVAEFRLPDKRCPPALMSYGARKRLQAAAYHLLDKRLVIFDEGDSGLDAGEFIRLIRLFQAPERGLLVITHDLALAEHLADDLVRMKKGRIA
jgi:energy-coupling factor transporter ATP-binding protein EcfA2